MPSKAQTAAKAEAQTLRELFDRRATTSQAVFGRENNLGSSSMVYQYLSGRRTLNLLAGIRFAAGMGVDLKSFSPRLAAELDGALRLLPKTRPSSDELSEYARIQCVQLQFDGAKRGYKTKPLEEAGAFIAFRNDWLRQRNFESSQLLALQMNDEGMRPTIANGDLLVINTADKSLADATVFAINYEGDLRIRRLVRDAGVWWLYCDNPDIQRFPKKQFHDKHCYVLGRVVHRQSEVV